MTKTRGKPQKDLHGKGENFGKMAPSINFRALPKMGHGFAKAERLRVHSRKEGKTFRAEKGNTHFTKKRGKKIMKKSCE